MSTEVLWKAYTSAYTCQLRYEALAQELTIDSIDDTLLVPLVTITTLSAPSIPLSIRVQILTHH
jgi:hypothetical protein